MVRYSPSSKRRELYFAFLFALLLSATNFVEAQHDDDDDDDDDDDALPGMPSECEKGSCPSPSINPNDNQGTCTLWLGPSPIKQAESHGFGLGLFTGKAIRQGEIIEGPYYGNKPGVTGEPLLSLFGSSTIYNEHPPLREYIWDEMNFPEVPLEYPHDETAMFVPGLSAIAPCTSHNFNVEFDAPGTVAQKTMVSNNGGVHRSTHRSAGSFAYRSVAYRAVRDISPGEELTVNCADDSFDGGAYFLSRFNETDNAVTCLDNVRVERTNYHGKGLTASKRMERGAVILSTPLIPVHRREMDIDDAKINAKQQTLNYCYGDPDSDLLLLPMGPLVNYINHGDTPNAVVQWHKPKNANDSVQRRLQYHHEELFELPADTVAQTHGKGLVFDIVALRDIHPDEPILLDYGPQWRDAWHAHELAWSSHTHDQFYQSAVDFLKSGEQRLRTVTEQMTMPYPKNMETFCFYHLLDKNTVEFRHADNNLAFLEWSDEYDSDHECFRPCTLMERQHPEHGEDRYTVQLNPSDNIRIIDWCIIDNPYLVTNVPAHAIRLVDSPYTTDEFLKESFRHEIGVPSDVYPSAWKRKKLRRANPAASEIAGDEFKRKVSAGVGPKAKRTL